MLKLPTGFALKAASPLAVPVVVLGWLERDGGFTKTKSLPLLQRTILRPVRCSAAIYWLRQYQMYKNCQ